MSKDTLTERETWATYWTAYKPEIVQRKNQFQQLFERIPDGNGTKTFLELGGFPGTFAVYFKKFKNYRVSLLDYFVSRPIVDSLLQMNQIQTDELQVIEADLFAYDSDQQYDLVFSSGLIEHFEDTGNIIKKHVDLIKDGGTLLITLPNLRGLNGWLQKTFHQENFEIHNLKCMDIDHLRQICESLGLHNLEVNFTGKPMVWLEAEAPVKSWFRKLVKLKSLALKAFPIKGYFLSPFIYILARK